MKTAELFERIGDDMVFGLKRSGQRVRVVMSLVVVGIVFWDIARRGKINWFLIGLAGLFTVQAIAQLLATRKLSSQLVVSPTELTWNGGDHYKKRPAAPVRAPRGALTRVWLHGPARPSARRKRMSQWHVSAVLEGEGLPVDVTAAIAFTHEEGSRIGRELATELAVPFEDRTD